LKMPITMKEFYIEHKGKLSMENIKEKVKTGAEKLKGIFTSSFLNTTTLILTIILLIEVIIIYSIGAIFIYAGSEKND